MENNLGMKFGLKAMKYIGQNLERKSKRADDLIWGLFTANVTLCYVLSILEPMLNFEGFERLPEYLDVICNYHVFVTILSLYRLKRNDIMTLTKPLGFWAIDYVSPQITLVQKKYYKFIYRCFVLTFIIGFILIAATFLKPFVQKERKLPLAFYNIIDFSQSPYYEIFNLMFVLHSTFLYIMVTALDGIFYCALCFVYCQVNMLKEKLRSLDMEYVDKQGEEKCFQVVKESAELFSNILDYVNKIGKTYSLILLSRFILTAVDCTMPLYFLVNMRVTDTTIITRAASFVAVALWIMFLQCVATSVVLDEISTIAFSVYEAKWIGDISPRLRLGSLIIAHRAQRGAEIKAGGLINVNVQNFGSVCRFAFSSYTILTTIVTMKQ